MIDSGLGISKDKQEMLFVPFKAMQKMHGIVEDVNAGIGLGLASCHQIISTMKGDICLKESSNNVTSFRFKVPVDIEEDIDEFTDKQVKRKSKII